MRFRTRETLTYLLMFTTLGVGLATVGYLSLNEDPGVWFSKTDAVENESGAVEPGVSKPDAEADAPPQPTDTRTLARRPRKQPPAQSQTNSVPAAKRLARSHNESGDEFETRPPRLRSGKTVGWSGPKSVFYNAKSSKRGHGVGTYSTFAGRPQFMANSHNKSPLANVVYGDTIRRGGGPKVYTGPNSRKARHRGRHRSHRDGAAYFVYRRSI